jgi:hypothetical protein
VFAKRIKTKPREFDLSGFLSQDGETSCGDAGGKSTTTTPAPLDPLPVPTKRLTRERSLVWRPVVRNRQENPRNVRPPDDAARGSFRAGLYLRGIPEMGGEC